MTINEIKQKLDELGIEYNNRARKDDLLKLLNEHSSEKIKGLAIELDLDHLSKEEQKENPKQKSYVVVYHRFKDLEDNNKIYKKGDKFNHVGKSKERIESLSTRNNKIGKVLIKEQA